MPEPPLISEQQISLPYTYTAGAAQRAGLNGLREGRIIASHGGPHTVVPARPFAADGTALTETIELDQQGVLEAVTVGHHLEGTPAFGLIRLPGATTLLLHRLGGGAERLRPGDAVVAQWRQERSGSILDIDHFRPA
jgi:uncharacterized OB-fold protein